MPKFKKQMQKLPLQKNLVLKQDFSYSKGDCQLQFTLRIKKSELQDFKELLEEAIKDLTETLKE